MPETGTQKWLVGQAVKTPPSHGGIRGSIPLSAAKKKSSRIIGSFFVAMNYKAIKNFTINRIERRYVRIETSFAFPVNNLMNE